MTSSTHRSSRLIDRTPFFYGWVILGAGTVGSVMMGASQTFTIGIFIEPWVLEFGISRSSISLYYGVATLCASLLLPITGRLTDRLGARYMIVIAALLLGFAYAGMAWIQGGITLFIALLLVRFLGFGSMQLISSHVIAQWFIRRRGTVMGLANQSLAISLLIWPALAVTLSTLLGWRDTWIVFGVMTWVIMIPAGGLLFRDTPERYGQRPDGDVEHAQLVVARGPVSEVNWTLAEARSTGVFWLFACGLAIMTMIMSGIVFHQVSLFEARGLSREVAVRAFQVTALASVVGNLGVGRSLDTMSARRILTLVLLILAIGMFILATMTKVWHALIFAVLFGLASGSYRVMDSTVWAKYFGRKHLGAIRGATMIGTLGGTALGAYPLGLSYDLSGSYGVALAGLMVFPTILALVAVFTQRPEKDKTSVNGGV